jgi:hypothetical protein
MDTYRVRCGSVVLQIAARQQDLYSYLGLGVGFLSRFDATEETMLIVPEARTHTFTHGCT